MKKPKVMEDGDLDSAEAVTFRRYAEEQENGTTIIRNVLERLDSSPQSGMSQQIQIDTHTPQRDDFINDNGQATSPPQTPRPKKCRVSTDVNSCINTFI